MELDRVLPFLPKAAGFSEFHRDHGGQTVVDDQDDPLGFVVQTSPQSDEVIGYSGPTNTLIAFDTDPYRADSPLARRVVFRDAAGSELGSAYLGIAVRPHLASAPEIPDVRRAMALEVSATRPVAGYFAANPGPLARFLGAGPDGLGAACRTLRAELTDRLGLSAFDASAVLRALARTHALFATGGDYGRDCLDVDLEAPAKGLKAATAGQLNAVLGRIGAGLRGDTPDKTVKVLAPMFADSVALFDYSGLWLAGTEAALVGAGRLDVLPGAGPDQAAAYLADLPVVHFACYSDGSGLTGVHRAALVQLEHDSGLWVLDVAFDGQRRIAGVSLAEADRRQVCRAVGNRKSGPDACFFAASGNSYRGIDPAGC